MEHPSMISVTTNDELFRLVMPRIIHHPSAPASEAILGCLTDFCYALLLYKPIYEAAKDKLSEQESLLLNFLQQKHPILCFRFHGHNMGIILYHSWDWQDVQRQTEEIEQSITEYLCDVRKETGLEFNLSIGRPFMGLLNLIESYAELINSTMTFTLRPNNLVVSEYDIVNDPALMGEPYPRSEIERQFADAIINLEISKAELIMENIIENEISTLRLKLSFLPRMAIRIEWVLIVLHVPRNSGDPKSVQIYSYPQRIKYAEKIEEGIALIHDFFHQLDDYYKAFRFNVGKDITQITEYIHEQAANPNLSATMICDRFRISPSYLSHLFKRRTGIKLVDYIHKTRLQRAKKLLETTSYSISEISCLVGYTNSASFSTTFKRYESMTPREYRDKTILSSFVETPLDKNEL